jgi:hypothetical protein
MTAERISAFRNLNEPSIVHSMTIQCPGLYSRKPLVGVKDWGGGTRAGSRRRDTRISAIRKSVRATSLGSVYSQRCLATCGGGQADSSRSQGRVPSMVIHIMGAILVLYLCFKLNIHFPAISARLGVGVAPTNPRRRGRECYLHRDTSVNKRYRHKQMYPRFSIV